MYFEMKKMYLRTSSSWH